MSHFFTDYAEGEPVAVYQGDKLVGIPCAFALYEDGISWADDAVLQDMPTQNPYHHLYGEVTFEGSDIVCEGYRFTPSRAWDFAFNAAWNSFEKEATDWMVVHDRVEYDLRQDRSYLAVQSVETPDRRGSHSTSD